jgi:hypothetical protein
MDVEKNVTQSSPSDVEFEPTGTAESTELSGITLLKRIKGEPAYRDLMYEILAFSITPKTT